jgi:hypothetical protein
MTILYLVRCNYADPESEAAWNAWYSGDKQDWLLSRPGFLAGQRFEAVRASDGVRYAALYTIESAGALQTPEYQSGWGWGDWRPNIIDWSRGFFDGVRPADYLTTLRDQRLRMVFVARTADETLARAAFPAATWLSADGGLDEALRAVGLERVDGDAGAMAPIADGIEMGIFAPASPPRTSARA